MTESRNPRVGGFVVTFEGVAGIKLIHIGGIQHGDHAAASLPDGNVGMDNETGASGVHVTNSRRSCGFDSMASSERSPLSLTETGQRLTHPQAEEPGESRNAPAIAVFGDFRPLCTRPFRISGNLMTARDEHIRVELGPWTLAAEGGRR